MLKPNTAGLGIGVPYLTFVALTKDRARRKTLSSMDSVRRPVKVFCWLGW